MADSLAVNLKTSLDWLFRETLDLSTVADSAKVEYSASLADGIGAGQADKVWHDQRTLASAANDDLDLTALTSNIFGSNVTISFAKVRAIMIVNLATTAGYDLAIGGAAAAEWSAPFAAAGDKVKCPADSCLVLTNKLGSWTVTNGTADMLRINNSGAGNIDYKIVIVGTSA